MGVRRTPRAAVVAVVAVLVSGVGRPASGEGPARVHVVVEPGSACGDAATLERELFARSHRPRGVGEPGDARVSIHVAAEGGVYVGRLVVKEPGDEPRSRVVRGAACEEVTRSLVLGAALALTEDATPSPRRPIDPDDRPPDRPPAPTPSPAPRVRVAIGVHGGLEAAGGDTPGFGGDLFLDLEGARRGFSPALRLALGAGRTEIARERVTIALVPIAARLDPSFLRAESGAWSARIAAALELGAVVADASGAARGTRNTRPWLRAGVSTRGSVRVSGALSLEVDAALLFPLVRDEFVVAPAEAAYRPPIVVPQLRAGASIALP